jgi:hypothetical protein
MLGEGTPAAPLRRGSYALVQPAPLTCMMLFSRCLLARMVLRPHARCTWNGMTWLASSDTRAVLGCPPSKVSRVGGCARRSEGVGRHAAGAAVTYEGVTGRTVLAGPGTNTASVFVDHRTALLDSVARCCC